MRAPSSIGGAAIARSSPRLVKHARCGKYLFSGPMPRHQSKFSPKLKYSPPTPSFFSCVTIYTISPNHRSYLPDFSYSQPFEHFACENVLLNFLPNSLKQWVLQVTASFVRIKYAWKYCSGGRALRYAASSSCLYLANTHLCNLGVVAWKETPR